MVGPGGVGLGVGWWWRLGHGRSVVRGRSRVEHRLVGMCGAGCWLLVQLLVRVGGVPAVVGVVLVGVGGGNAVVVVMLVFGALLGPEGPRTCVWCLCGGSPLVVDRSPVWGWVLLVCREVLESAEGPLHSLQALGRDAFTAALRILAISMCFYRFGKPNSVLEPECFIG